MTKCPTCGEEITTLLNIQSGYIYYAMDKDGEYEECNEFEANNNVNEWVCPECDATLLYNEEDAIEFLNKKEDEVKQE